MSAADLIKRFREAPPTARNARKTNPLWYDNMKERDDLEESEIPRALPKPMSQSTRPSELLTSFRKPQEGFMSNSIDIDNIIENELNVLSKELYNRDTRNMKSNYVPRLGMSFNNSYDFTPEKTVRAESPTPVIRFGAKARNNMPSPLRLSESRDFMNSSFETLGSTGFRGLLVPDLKLDGVKQDKDEEKPVTDNESDMKALNASLESLMKALAENQSGKDHNPYFPEGAEHSIAQVTNILDTHMQGFKSLFGGKHAEEDQQEQALKDRDAEMREQGRKEERERRMLEWDFPVGPLDLHHLVSANTSPMGQMFAGMESLGQSGLLGSQSHFIVPPVMYAPTNGNPAQFSPFSLAPLDTTSQPQQTSANAQMGPNNPGTGDDDSPFPLLEKGISVSGVQTNDSFPVDNPQQEKLSKPQSVSTDDTASDAANKEPHVELSPSDIMAAQQMRELSARLSEKAEMLRAMTESFTGERPHGSQHHVSHAPHPAQHHQTHLRAHHTSHHGQHQHPSHQSHPYAHRSNEHMRRFHDQPYPLHSQQHIQNNHPKYRHNSAAMNSIRHQQQDHNRYERNGLVVPELDFEPLPELEHKNVYSAARAIESSLNVAMDCLHKRLPPDISTMSLVERIKFNMQKERDAEALAAGGGKPTIGASPVAAASSSGPTPTAKSKLSLFASRSVSPIKESSSSSSSSVSGSDKEIVGKMAANLVDSVLKDATAPAMSDASGPPKTAVVAPKNTFGLKSATPVRTLGSVVSAVGAPKTASQELDDLDLVLGADGYRGAHTPPGKKPAATLGLGQFVPADSSVMKQQRATAAPTLQQQQQQQPNSLTGNNPTSHSIPLPWENSIQNTSYLHPSVAVDHRNLQGIMAPSARPPVHYQAPTDQQLYQQQHYSTGVPPSAPPSHMSPTTPLFSFPTAPAQHSAVPPASRHPPVAGSAMQHLREQTPHGEDRYPQDSPLFSPQHPKHHHSLQQQQYAPTYQQSPVSVVSNNFSSPDATTHEKEVFLRRMRQLREQHLLSSIRE